MKKIDPGQTISILANLGVIGGIVLLALELQQNNDLLSAQARAERASVPIGVNAMNLSNPELMRIKFRARSGADLTAEEEFWMEEVAWGTFVRWQFVWGEFDAGLIDREAIPTEDWRISMEDSPQTMRFWREYKDIAFRADFVQFVEEEVLNRR